MTYQLVPLFGPIPGGIELAVIVLIAILLFGANKIPKLARSTGQAMGEFKKGREEVERELSEMRGGVEEELSPESTTTEPAVEPAAESEPETVSEPEPEAETEVETEEETEKQN